MSFHLIFLLIWFHIVQSCPVGNGRAGQDQIQDKYQPPGPPGSNDKPNTRTGSKNHVTCLINFKCQNLTIR